MGRSIKHNPNHCPYCGAFMVRENPTPGKRPPLHLATRDHVVAKSKGGRIIITCCLWCNQNKGDQEFLAWIGSAKLRIRIYETHRGEQNRMPLQHLIQIYQRALRKMEKVT